MIHYFVLYVSLHNLFIILSLTFLNWLKNQTKQHKSKQQYPQFLRLFDFENTKAEISSLMLLLAQSELEKLESLAYKPPLARKKKINSGNTTVVYHLISIWVEIQLLWRIKWTIKVTVMETGMDWHSAVVFELATLLSLANVSNFFFWPSLRLIRKDNMNLRAVAN